MATKRRTGKLDRFNGPPSGDFQVNQDLAKSLGLVAWYPMAGARGGFFAKDYIGACHVPLPTIQTPSWTYDKDQGVEFNLSTASTTVFTPISSVPPPTGNENPISLFAWIRTFSSQVLGCYFATTDGASNSSGVWLGSDPSGNMVGRSRNGGGTDTITGAYGGLSTVNFLATTIGFDGVNNMNLYLNAVDQGNTVSVDSGYSSAIRVGIMRGQYDGEGSFFEGGICKKKLSQSEVSFLYNNRWDLYEPMHPTFYSIPGTVQPVKRTRHSINGGWPY